jgi:hypothetical protein
LPGGATILIEPTWEWLDAFICGPPCDHRHRWPAGGGKRRAGFRRHPAEARRAGEK